MHVCVGKVHVVVRTVGSGYDDGRGGCRPKSTLKKCTCRCDGHEEYDGYDECRQKEYEWPVCVFADTVVCPGAVTAL